MKTIKPWRQLAVFALAGLSVTACGSKDAATAAQAQQQPAPTVGVVEVAPQAVTVAQELPGRTEASRVAEVRARAAGIVLERAFEEGSEVKAGDVLFRIDPVPLQAALNSAKAQLARAQASLKQARATATRYEPLAKANAISQQDYDNAVAARDQAAAEVAAAKAAVETAEIRLGYATVTAPISGRIGRELVTEGALVGQGEPTAMAKIQQLDPIYVNLSQSSTELLRLRRALAEGKLQGAGEEAKVVLVTEDGYEYPHAGKLLFSDVSVDESTGAVSLRAQFPNPDRFLLPGMYVRARLEQAVSNAALTVPQQAVHQSPRGASVMVVAEDGTAQMRPVRVGRLHGADWVIESGIQAGDKVIVDGMQMLRPGTPVNPVAWQNPLANKAVAAAAEPVSATQAN